MTPEQNYLPGPTLFVPDTYDDKSPKDLKGAIVEMKTHQKKRALVDAGVSTDVHDPARLTDRDVDNLIYAQAKRDRRKARNRAVYERNAIR